jgi:hypothetical protein
MTLKRALMNAQDLTAQEAQELIDDMRQQVLEGCDPEELLHDEGLEPDYILELF